MTTKTITKANPHVASDLDGFLGELDLSDQAQAVAVKRVLAYEPSATCGRRSFEDGHVRMFSHGLAAER